MGEDKEEEKENAEDKEKQYERKTKRKRRKEGRRRRKKGSKGGNAIMVVDFCALTMRSPSLNL